MSCKKPCKECPFNRNSVLKPGADALGGSHAGVYIGQAEGPFWLPCHMDKQYQGKESDINKVSQCRGAAIYRSNIEVAHKMPKELLTLEKNTEDVFESHAEFLMHHEKLNKETALHFLKFYPPSYFLRAEMRKQEVKVLSFS
jgi:hypothetical protein